MALTRKSSSPTAGIGLAEAKAAFLDDHARRSAELDDHPVLAFLEAHELAGSPNELTITGVAGVKVTLGDLRQFVRLVM